MIRGPDIEPIDHIPPRRRIDLNAASPEQHALESTAEVCARHDRTARGHRIWRIIVDMASKGN